MLAILSVFLITLGLGQLISTHWKLRGASLIGSSRLAGYGLGVLLLVSGALIMPGNWSVLWWTLLAGPLAVILLIWGGSYIFPPPHPHRLFEPNHPAHSGCYPAQIPDGDDSIPGLLLFPPRLLARREKTSSLDSFSEKEGGSPAICLIPGSGCTKTFFNWRLVRALLAEGLIVLTIDPPGHGDYRHRLLTYPDCLSTIPAAVRFLREQPGVTKVGLVGISLGGALAIRSLVENSLAKSEIDSQVDALVLLEVPVRVNYSRALFYRELWRTLYGSPGLLLLKEMSVKQVGQEWYSGGYHGQYSTAELIALLNPLESIRWVKDVSILLVYSHRDPIAPPEAVRAMQQAAPQARFIESKKASHVMLTLLPEINRQVALWLRERLQS
jgi:pimeloyl-ACP methyl ester carboxylesterase